MKLKLKESILNSLIYLPIERRDIMGKFIDQRLYPYLFKKYPNFFDIELEETKKTIKNDLSIDNSKQQSNDYNSSK